MAATEPQRRRVRARRRLALAIAAAAAVLPPAPPAGAQATAAAPASPVTIEEVRVEPPEPGPDTLCKLRVRLRNAGAQIASQLAFTVKVNGQELAPYHNQLFMFPLAAGEEAELPLYNFWTTETSRPLSADGKLAVEVSLTEARWMAIGMEGEVEVWTPGEAVPGLPVRRALTLQLKR